MNKKIILGFVAVLVVTEILSFIQHYVLLGATYEALQSLWRPDMASKMWIYHFNNVIVSFLFSFIFSHGYRGTGLGEGLRYGLYIGILLSLGMAYGTYAMIAIPYSLAMQWFIYGVLQYVILGAVVATVFGKVKA